MTDLTPQSNPTDPRVFDFSQYVLSEMLEKLTLFSTTMNDSSNQVKILTTLSLQSPTRLELLERINQISGAIKQYIDDSVVESLKENHKEISAATKINTEKIIEKLDLRDKEFLLLSVEIGKNTVMLVETTQQLKVIVESIKKSNIIVGILVKVLSILIASVPILWSLFTWLNTLYTKL